MTHGNRIWSVGWADEERVTALIGLAFAADPYVRWLLPDPYNYLASNREYVRLSSAPAFDRGSAHVIGDFLGAALWLPPDAVVDSEPLISLNDRYCDPAVIPDFLRLIEKSGAFRPATPHWYLTLIAVDPARRGRGHGSALLAHGLRMCDRDGLPAYLESTNRANLSLYARFGFKLLAELQVGDSPMRYPMLRCPPP